MKTASSRSSSTAFSDVLDVRDLLKLFASEKAEIVELIGPKLEVVLAGDAKEFPLVNEVRGQFEGMIEVPMRLSVDDRDVWLSFSDFLRGYLPLTEFIGSVYHELKSYKPAAGNALVEPFCRVGQEDR